IGLAQLSSGKGGAAAGFAREFDTDPLARRGLVWSLTGVIVETLLSCSEADPRALGGFRVNWKQYYEHCRYELEQRAGAGQDVTEDVASLWSGRARYYLGLRALSQSLRRRFEPIRRMMLRTPLKAVVPPYDGWRRRLGLPKQSVESLSTAVTYED